MIFEPFWSEIGYRLWTKSLETGVDFTKTGMGAALLCFWAVNQNRKILHDVILLMLHHEFYTYKNI